MAATATATIEQPAKRQVRFQDVPEISEIPPPTEADPSSEDAEATSGEPQLSEADIEALVQQALKNLGSRMQDELMPYQPTDRPSVAEILGFAHAKREADKKEREKNDGAKIIGTDMGKIVIGGKEYIATTTIKATQHDGADFGKPREEEDDGKTVFIGTVAGQEDKFKAAREKAKAEGKGKGKEVAAVEEEEKPKNRNLKAWTNKDPWMFLSNVTISHPTRLNHEKLPKPLYPPGFPVVMRFRKSNDPENLENKVLVHSTDPEKTVLTGQVDELFIANTGGAMAFAAVYRLQRMHEQIGKGETVEMVAVPSRDPFRVPPKFMLRTVDQYPEYLGVFSLQTYSAGK